VSSDRLAFSAIADVDRKSITDYSPEHALGPAEIASGAVIDTFEIDRKGF